MARLISTLIARSDSSPDILYIGVCILPGSDEPDALTRTDPAGLNTERYAVQEAPADVLG